MTKPESAQLSELTAKLALYTATESGYRATYSSAAIGWRVLVVVVLMKLLL